MNKPKRAFIWAMAATLALGCVSCGRSAKSLQIEGLYLGMPLAEAMAKTEDIYRRLEGEKFRPLQWRQWDSFSIHTDRGQTEDITLRTSDGGVRLICINPGLVDRIFGSASNSAEQLAQRFSRDHGLPAMKRGIDRNPPQPVHYWEHVSRRGWKAVVRQDKTLILEYWRSEKNMK